MGNNAAYTDFEEITIGLYNIGKLDLLVLDVLGQCFFSYPDIDSGGSRDLLTNDKKGMEQVVVEFLNPQFVPDEEFSWYDEFYESTRKRWQQGR